MNQLDELLSCKDDINPGGLFRSPRRANNDLNIAAKLNQALKHFRLADTPEPAPAHIRDFRLGHSHDCRSFLLGQLTVFDDVGDLHSELRFDLHLLGVRSAKILDKRCLSFLLLRSFSASRR